MLKAALYKFPQGLKCFRIVGGVGLSSQAGNAPSQNLVQWYGLTSMQVETLHERIGRLLKIENLEHFSKLLEYPAACQTDLAENLDLLKIFGFSEADRKSLLLRSASLFTMKRETLEVTMGWYLKDLGITADELKRIVVQYPPLLNFDVETKLSEFLNVFLDTGFTVDQVRSIVVRHPESVGRAWVTKVDTMLDTFRSVGFGRFEFANLVHKTPRILRNTAEDRAELLSCLLEAGLTKEEVQEVIVKSADLTIHSFRSNLKPKLDFFIETAGIPKETVVKKIIVKAPFSFARVRLGTIQNAYKTFLELGFDQESYKAMICSSPFILGQGSKNVRDKVDFAVSFLKRELKDISQWPPYLTFALEDRIMFRIAAKCAKGESVDEIGFRTLLHPGDERFFSRYEKGFYSKFSKWWKGLNTEAKWVALKTQKFL